MRKTVSKIAMISATILLSQSLISSPFVYDVTANNLVEKTYYSYDFETLTKVPTQWEIVSYNNASSLTVSDGALMVNNQSATYSDSDTRDDATEITLPPVTSDNYAIEFDFYRLESAQNASISIKYAIQSNGAGYEFRIPMAQHDANHPFWYTHNTAMEYRKVLAGGSVKGNVNNYRFWNLNFYPSEFFKTTAYHFTFLRNEGRNRLFINGVEYLNHDDNNKIYMDDETGSFDRYVGGDMILRFNRAIQAKLDNLSVKTPAKYLQERVEALGDTSAWENSTILQNVGEIKAIRDLYCEMLDETQRADLEAYQTIESVWKKYCAIVAPKITVSEGLKGSVSVGTEIDLSAMATAKDYQERELAVEIQVLYQNKHLLVKNGKASFNEAGEYLIRFIAYDRNGIGKTVERTVVAA